MLTPVELARGPTPFQFALIPIVSVSGVPKQVGVEGLMVRDGALAEPVREATIASTLQRMLKDVVAIGSDLEWLPGGAAGVTVVIGDVTLSGS